MTFSACSVPGTLSGDSTYPTVFHLYGTAVRLAVVRDHIYSARYISWFGGVAQ